MLQYETLVPAKQLLKDKQVFQTSNTSIEITFHKGIRADHTATIQIIGPVSWDDCQELSAVFKELAEALNYDH